MPMKIGINGTGLITRAIVKLAAFNEEFREIDIVQINGRSMDIDTLKDRLLFSTAHGHSKLEVEVDKDENIIIVNGKKIKYSQQTNPEEIEWLPEIELMIEATGSFRDTRSNSGNPYRHFKSPNNNLRCIIISAPGKGDIKDFMYIGSPNLNDDIEALINSGQPFVIGGASCTTTAAVPIIDTLDENFGIESCFLTTIHAVTRSQEILDGSGGWSGLDTQLHTTGATSSTNKVLKKKIPMNGIAYRTADKSGSFIQIDAQLKRNVELLEINQAFKDSKYAKFISYPTVNCPSTSYILGDTGMVLLIPEEFVIINGNRVIIKGLYDNEEGYASHFMRLVKQVSSLLK
ncbi:MAG: glyceraldehyde 3-phosphate dehydrogenase NAD-binding domain-containing protein [Candidatus Thorarchaeota archaeon]